MRPAVAERTSGCAARFALPCRGGASLVGQDKGDVARRALGVLLAALLAFGCVVMIGAMGDIGATPTCHDISVGNAAVPADGECFQGSSLQKTVTLGLGWPSGMIAGAAGLLALAFVITGRPRRLALMLAGLAAALGALSVLIGSL
jgi:hypothetical protein